MNVQYLRRKVKKVLREKYYNLFANNYNFVELSYQQNDYIKKKLFYDGRIACFKIKNADTLKLNYDGLCFAPFTESDYNCYDYPIHIRLINERNVAYIDTSKTYMVDDDIVIGYIKRTKNPIKPDVDYYIDRLTDLEMLINLQQILHKTPYIIPANEDNQDRIKDFMNKLIESDEPVIFCEVDEVQLFKSIVNGATFIMDKLYMMKQNYENELLTLLGIDNMGGSQKKEHLITDEVESNNMLIKDSCDCYVDTMREFCDRIGKVLGSPVTLECKSESYLLEEEEMEEEDNKDNKDNKDNSEEE